MDLGYEKGIGERISQYSVSSTGREIRFWDIWEENKREIRRYQEPGSLAELIQHYSKPITYSDEAYQYFDNE